MLFLVFSLVPTLILSAAVGPCCKEKEVGGILYLLHDVGNDTQMWGCLNNCTYIEETTLKKYCFARGNLKVECLDAKPWCYEGECGPAKYWAEHFKDCGGQRQSPIDIITTNVIPPQGTPNPLTFTSYGKVVINALSSNVADDLGDKGDRLENHEFDNNGHTAVLGVKTEGPNDGVMRGGPLGDKTYQMLQMHFHWGANDDIGSEHTVNGVSYPIELHLVHINNAAPTGELDLAVAGFFFEISDDDNDALQPLINQIKNIIEYDTFQPVANISFQVEDLIPMVIPEATGTFYNYPGSLTTPPCSEVVTWIVFKDPLKISASQLATFRTMMDVNKEAIVDNFRPVMPLNGREVVKYN